MNHYFYNQIEQSTAHRASRDTIKDLVLNNLEYLPELINIALNANDKNHHKACWILELILEKKELLIKPFLTKFCASIGTISNDSAIRSLSKIVLFIAKSKDLKRNETQENQLIEACFDWLLTTDKAANAAYCMRALYLFSKKQPWIVPELKSVLSRDCSHQTPGYIFAVKDMIARLK